MNSKEYLKACDLAKSYKKRPVVKNISLNVERGTIVGLLGPNGAGKTTCFYMIVGLINAEKGKIFLNQEDITQMPMHERARRGVGYLPQEKSIFRKMTVADNILAILELRDDLNKHERLEKLESLLQEFHITHLKNSLGMSLSGGECRRVEIARALACEPTFLLLDEPFTGIDPISVTDIQRLIQHLSQKNIGILITDHKVAETLKICDHAYIIFDGNVLMEGSPDRIIENQQVKEVYLGENFIF